MVNVPTEPREFLPVVERVPPIYYRLQMGTGLLSDTYIDGIFDQAIRRLRRC